MKMMMMTKQMQKHPSEKQTTITVTLGLGLCGLRVVCSLLVLSSVLTVDLECCCLVDDSKVDNVPLDALNVEFSVILNVLKCTGSVPLEEPTFVC